ncbi:sporulation protein YpjB [Bacillus sp. CGMCC 1.16607]|uniref:sporulation protein YpjB n=1 Tax=Bacillus sp. CGMCC 1.16607 TaxID=3351842 RepID=UPI00363DBB43
MKAKVLSIFLTIFISLPFYVSAETMSPLSELDHISDDALQMVKLNRNEDAKKLLQYFSDKFLIFKGNGQHFSMDELRIVTISHNDALEAATSLNMDQPERINQLTKFRLVIDAISSSHQPLWTEMEGPIMTTFNQVKESANSGDHIGFHDNFNAFLQLYKMVYPSLKIDLSAERVQQLDARIKFIDEYRPEIIAQATSQKELFALETDLKSIFDEMSEDEADPSLWWVMISTGSIIIMTLSYVGWKKYKGDKEIKKDYKRDFRE